MHAAVQVSAYISVTLTDTYSNLPGNERYMAESSNTAPQDSNQKNESSEVPTKNQQTADSVGKTFLRNVKDKWNSVPQGWAQKRTSSLESNDSSSTLLPTMLEPTDPGVPPSGLIPDGDETQ